MAKAKSKISKIAGRLLRELKSKNIAVQKLILFGSYANGKAKTYSDIDIAVISSSFEGINLLKRQELLGEAVLPLNEPVEILGYTPHEVKNILPASFLAEILSTGKVIYPA